MLFLLNDFCFKSYIAESKKRSYLEPDSTLMSVLVKTYK